MPKGIPFTEEQKNALVNKIIEYVAENPLCGIYTAAQNIKTSDYGTKLSKSVVHRWFKEPKLKERLKEAKEVNRALSRDYLLNKSVVAIERDKNYSVLMFLMRTMFKEEFSERTELTGADGGAIQTETSIKESDKALLKRAALRLK